IVTSRPEATRSATHGSTNGDVVPPCASSGNTRTSVATRPISGISIDVFDLNLSGRQGGPCMLGFGRGDAFGSNMIRETAYWRRLELDASAFGKSGALNALEIEDWVAFSVRLVPHARRVEGDVCARLGAALPRCFGPQLTSIRKLPFATG